MWAGFLAYLGVLATAPRLGVRIVGVLIVVFVVAFACAPVLLSHDVFSYVDYARLGVRHGLDPYVNAPDAAPTDPAFAHVTWTETPSAYGPLFTLATYPLAWLPIWAAVAILKAVAAISVLGLAWVVARLAAWRGVDPARAAAFVALNPLVLVHVVGGAHNDGLAMLLTTLGVAALVAGRESSAGASLVASAAIKSSSLFVAPFALLTTLRDSVPTGRKPDTWAGFRPVGGGLRRNAHGAAGRLVLGALAAAVVIGAAGYLGFGWEWLHAFGLAGKTRDGRATSRSRSPSPASPASTRVRCGWRRSASSASRSSGCWSAPGAAPTGSAPPPGPAPACCWRPPGSSPGTCSGRCRSPPSLATACWSRSSSPSPPTSSAPASRSDRVRS